MKFSIFSKWMFTLIIRNLFNSSRVFFHTWRKWRSYSHFAFMLFWNLTPLDGSFVNAIVFCRKSEFCEYITSLHIQHSIYVRQFEFFVFSMKQIASKFCNVSFAGQYIFDWYFSIYHPKKNILIFAHCVFFFYRMRLYSIWLLPRESFVDG